MELYQKLIAYVKAHYPWCRTVSAIELKALQLHASRVSENPSLDGYSQFHPKIVVHEKTNEQEEKHMSASQNHINRMRELIEQLRAADVAYYRDDNPTMTDHIKEQSLIQKQPSKSEGCFCIYARKAHNIRLSGLFLFSGDLVD